MIDNKVAEKICIDLNSHFVDLSFYYPNYVGITFTLSHSSTYYENWSLWSMPIARTMNH